MIIGRMQLIHRQFGESEIQRWLLAEGSREEIIEWLVWNDGNGVHTGEDSAAEGYEPLTLGNARKIKMMMQITAHAMNKNLQRIQQGDR